MARLPVLTLSTPEGAVVDKVVEQLKGEVLELIASNLRQEQENQLKAAFAAE